MSFETCYFATCSGLRRESWLPRLPAIEAATCNRGPTSTKPWSCSKTTSSASGSAACSNPASCVLAASSRTELCAGSRGSGPSHSGCSMAWLQTAASPTTVAYRLIGKKRSDGSSFSAAVAARASATFGLSS